MDHAVDAAVTVPDLIEELAEAGVADVEGQVLDLGPEGAERGQRGPHLAVGLDAVAGRFDLGRSVELTDLEQGPAQRLPVGGPGGTGILSPFGQAGSTHQHQTAGVGPGQSLGHPGGDAPGPTRDHDHRVGAEAQLAGHGKVDGLAHRSGAALTPDPAHRGGGVEVEELVHQGLGQFGQIAFEVGGFDLDRADQSVVAFAGQGPHQPGDSGRGTVRVDGDGDGQGAPRRPEQGGLEIAEHGAGIDGGVTGGGAQVDHHVGLGELLGAGRVGFAPFQDGGGRAPLAQSGDQRRGQGIVAVDDHRRSALEVSHGHRWVQRGDVNLEALGHPWQRAVVVFLVGVVSGDHRLDRDGRRLSGGERLDPFDDGPQRLVLGQFLHHLLVDCALVEAGQADALGQFAHDLDPFDGVDAQVGFQVEVGVEHLDGVAGSFADDGLDLVHELFAGEYRHRRRWRAGGGRGQGLGASGSGRRGRGRDRGGRQSRLGGTGDHLGVVGKRGGGRHRGTQVAQHHVTFGGHDLADAAQVFQYDAAGIVGGVGHGDGSEVQDGQTVCGLKAVG